MTTTKLQELAARVDRLTGRSAGAGKDLSSGAVLLRETGTSEFEAHIYDPVMCLILQGEKETVACDRSITVPRGHCIVVSHDLPVIARVTKASPKKPYLAVVIQLNLEVLRSLYDELANLDVDGHGDGHGSVHAQAGDARALQVAPVDAATLEVIARYLDLLGDPVAARVLLPLVRRELHFRLFMSASGGSLRSLLRRDSHASSIARAIKTLREDYRNPLEVPVLAKRVGMSPSSFHQHFKRVTRTTPLQYQKDLRLTEARRLLRSGDASVSSAAFDVGYESPSQFSREYSRKFSVTPRDEVARAAVH